MNFLQSLKVGYKAMTMAFNSSPENKLYQAIYSFFNGFFYTLTATKETFVKEGYQGNISVNAAVKLIAGKAANAKLYVYSIDEQGKQKRLEKHWLNELLRKPNELVRQQQWIESNASFMLITGDLYLYKLSYATGDKKGKPAKVYVLPSQYMQIIGGGINEPIKGYKMIIGNQSVTFNADEVIHIAYFNPNYGINGEQLYGQSPLLAGINTVQSSNEATKAKIRAFLNGGMHGLITSADKDQTISQEQLTQVQDMIHQKISGASNYKGITATPAMLNYQQIGMSPADLELLKSISFDKEEICNMFGIDPILFSKESSSYNNKKEASKSLVYNVVTPLLNLLCDAYTDLTNEPNVYVGYDISHFEEVQQDLNTQVDALSKAWWISPNRKLEMMGEEMSKDEAMNKIYIPTNLTPIDEASLNMDNLKNIDYR